MCSIVYTFCLMLALWARLEAKIIRTTLKYRCTEETRRQGPPPHAYDDRELSEFLSRTCTAHILLQNQTSQTFFCVLIHKNDAIVYYLCPARIGSTKKLSVSNNGLVHREASFPAIMDEHYLLPPLYPDSYTLLIGESIEGLKALVASQKSRDFTNIKTAKIQVMVLDVVGASSEDEVAAIVIQKNGKSFAVKIGKEFQLDLPSMTMQELLP